MIANFRREGRAIEKSKEYQAALELRFSSLEKRVEKLEKVKKVKKDE